MTLRVHMYFFEVQSNYSYSIRIRPNNSFNYSYSAEQ